MTTKNVLITGGSSGIGLELTIKFIEGGYNIFWISLVEEELSTAKSDLQEKFPNCNIDYLALDLSNPDAQKKAFDWYHQFNMPLDVLINNAGFGVFGYSNETSLEKEVKMLQLNVINSFKLAKMSLELMHAQGHGQIINICSNTAFQPVPKMAAYAASKSFLSSYSLALEEELRQQKSKIKILTVYPAAIKDTKFKVASNMEKVKTFEGLMATTKQEVATDVWTAMQKNKSVILSGALHRRSRWLSKILPKSILNWMIAWELSEKG